VSTAALRIQNLCLMILAAVAVGFVLFWFRSVLIPFVLAVFVGFEVVTKVPPTLHTPLMSASNAISGITLIGALLLAGQTDNPQLSRTIAVVGVTFATINVVGGFLVTHRMLAMFRKKN
jgi:NAD(P) transhydrogenase subunit alpha